MKKGFTLIEALVAIALTAVIIGVFSASLTSTVFLRRTQYDLQAANLVQEELDSLRTLRFFELLNRSNDRFLGVSMNRGPWKVTQLGTAASSPNVLSLDTAQTAVLNETGVIMLPGNYRKDFTYTASIKALGASPAGWGAGIAFEYRDAENHYRFRFSSGGIAFDKVVQGATTTLWSQSATYNKDTWYTLQVIDADGMFTLKKNGTTLATVADATFSQGDLAVLSLSGGLVQADDVSVVENALTTSWNFDADPAGNLPEIWQRLSCLDLPSGACTLTIADYVSGGAVKQATATIIWKDGSAMRTASGTSLYAQ